MRKVLLSIRDFFCTKMPIISLVGIALCWFLYLGIPRDRSIDSMPKSYWNLMGVTVWAVMILGALFVLSVIAYMFYRPLPDKLKWLHIILRFLIALSVIFVTCIGIYLSIFIFAAAGY